MGGALDRLQRYENPEMPVEKVGMLDVRHRKKSLSGAAKKRVRWARLAKAPVGDSYGGQRQ
jgi:hypothetical protein